MLADEPLELGHELGVAAEDEVGLDPLLERGQPQLLETRDLSLCEGLERDVRERGAVPQSERRSQRVGRTIRLARGQQLSTVHKQALEPAEVELLGLEREQVPAPVGLQAPVAERLTELRDVDMDAVESARRRALTPKRIDQAIRRHDLARAQEKEHEQRPLLA